MKNIIRSLLILSLSLFAFWGCRENEVYPDEFEDRSSYSGLTDATVLITTEILSGLHGEIQDFGHVWSDTSTEPGLSDSYTSLGRGGIPSPMKFESYITGLKRGTAYVVRPYVKVSDRVIYGKSVSFTTDSDYIGRLVNIINDSLQGRDFGYSFVIMKDGRVVGSGVGGLQAREIEAGGARPVSLNSKMQIASMTKTLVTAAFFKLAEEKGLTVKDTISAFLPDYWTTGPNVNKITFGDLLQHRSGITGLGRDCVNGAFLENSWYGLQQLIEMGVEDRNIGNYCYQNANFGLFRVLIPGILGYEFTDEYTDMAETSKIFEEYLKRSLFSSAQLNPGLLFANDETSPTYGYDVPYSGGSGFNPGDFQNHAGGYGVYLSAGEAGALYSALFDDKDTRVLTQEQKDAILTSGYGAYSAITPEGRFSYHDGWWHIGLGEGKPRGFRSLWMKCPDNVVVVLFANGLRNGDGLFPIQSAAYQDITSYLLWCFSKLHAEGPISRKAEVNYHQYLTHPEPH